jgi:hypothetical protein
MKVKIRNGGVGLPGAVVTGCRCVSFDELIQRQSVFLP